MANAFKGGTTYLNFGSVGRSLSYSNRRSFVSQSSLDPQRCIYFPPLKSSMHFLQASQPATWLFVLLLFIDTTIARPPHHSVSKQVVPIPNDAVTRSLSLIPRDPPPASTTPYPLPSVNHYPLQLALDGGWSVAVHVFSYIYPVSSSTQALEGFFTGIQAYVLARMLQGFANPCRARFTEGDIVLALQMHPRSTVATVEWSVVYAFAQYMLRWVRRGFSGNGGFLFHHRSGTMLAAVLLNHDSVGLPENTVQPDVCPD